MGFLSKIFKRRGIVAAKVAPPSNGVTATSAPYVVVTPSQSKRTPTSVSGVLSKGWVSVNGKPCLVKANTEGRFEPFGEFIGSRLVSLLVGDTVEYDLMPADILPTLKTFNFPFVSICECWGDIATIPFSVYADKTSGEPINDYFVWLRDKASEPLLSRVIDMLVCDALIGNCDRHLNNWDIISASGTLAPLLTRNKRLAYFK